MKYWGSHTAHVALQEDMTRQLFDEGGFLTALKGKCSDIAINPVEYTKRIIVSYPDYSKEGPRQTYLTSSYCGMFFNYYC